MVTEKEKESEDVRSVSVIVASQLVSLLVGKHRRLFSFRLSNTTSKLPEILTDSTLDIFFHSPTTFTHLILGLNNLK